jgi:hypothetical protein
MLLCYRTSPTCFIFFFLSRSHLVEHLVCSIRSLVNNMEMQIIYPVKSVDCFSHAAPSGVTITNDFTAYCSNEDLI